MEAYLDQLQQTRLFAGISPAEISSMLHCLQARTASYQKGDYVFRQGDSLDSICVPLEGSLLIQKDDYWGKRSIVNRISTGDMFGEAYVTPDSGPLLNDVIAATDCLVIFFHVKKILTVCSSACAFHTMVVQNLFHAISAKNRMLIQKLGHMSERTTRDKLISYLSEQARQQGSATFWIPFNRQQLADFLSVDRSAMSNELCKMRDQGLLLFEKNKFTLL